MNRAAARRRRRGMATLLSVLLLTLLVGSAAAQAWVPEKGEGSLSTSYNYISSSGHFKTDGNKVAEAAAKAQSVLFDFEYGVTDKLAVNFSIPIVAARYADTNPPIAEVSSLDVAQLKLRGCKGRGRPFVFPLLRLRSGQALPKPGGGWGTRICL
jgi:hypothetical protein